MAPPRIAISVPGVEQRVTARVVVRNPARSIAPEESKLSSTIRWKIVLVAPDAASHHKIVVGNPIAEILPPGTRPPWIRWTTPFEGTQAVIEALTCQRSPPDQPTDTAT